MVNAKTARIIVILAALTISGSQCFAEDAAAAQPAAQNTDTPKLAEAEQAAAQQEEASKGLTEEWIQKTKHPVSWLKWGADLRAREEYLTNPQYNEADEDKNHQRYRFRLWADVMPTEYFSFSGRAMYVLRNFIDPKASRGVESGEVMFDNLYATLEPQDSNWRLRIGRQELIDMGQNWIVQDGTTRDGSRTTFFDSARFTWKFPDEETTMDAVYLYQCAKSDAWLPPIDMQKSRQYLAENDIQGGMLLLRNKHFEKTILDGLFIYKHEYPSDLASSISGDSVTFQPQVTVKWNDNWSMVARAAIQGGKRNDLDFLGYGGDAKVTYSFQDVVNSKLWVGFEYLSGDDSSPDVGFDPLWGRYPRISEIMAYTRVDSGRACDYSNMYSPYVGYSMEPWEGVRFSGTYRPMFAPENPLGGDAKHSVDGEFKGHLIYGIAEYSFTKHIKTHAVIETIMPGNFYTPDYRATALFIRGQVFLTW
ncbi:MAG: hypothetical protein IKS95_02195 [Verrucomicrobia bacterium]|nr:hypothetical protein [Verrucomicrobiota bacterium]